RSGPRASSSSSGLFGSPRCTIHSPDLSTRGAEQGLQEPCTYGGQACETRSHMPCAYGCTYGRPHAPRAASTRTVSFINTDEQMRCHTDTKNTLKPLVKAPSACARPFVYH